MVRNLIYHPAKKHNTTYNVRTSGNTTTKMLVQTIFLIYLASSLMKIYIYVRLICPVPTTSQNKNKSKYLCKKYREYIYLYV